MKRVFFHSIQGRIMTILIFFMTISLFGSFFFVRTLSQNIMNSEKANKLLLAASLLDFQLGDRSYEDILIENGMENASKEDKIDFLYTELSSFGDAMTELYPDLGVGYYSLELDAIITYAPSHLYKYTIGVPIGEDHPGRIVMQTNESMVRTGSMVRGNIMNAMHPIARNGQVIGYAWANELASGIETEYRTASTSILVFMFIIYLISVSVAIILSRTSMRDIQNIVNGVRLLRSDMSRTLPKAAGDLGEVVDSINMMAADVLKAEEDHKALMLAEAANLAQRDFLSRMSHEIRTPMNVVLGMTHLAQNAESEAQRLEYLGKIHTSAFLLLGIIDDILDISKIEAGKMIIEAHPFNFMYAIENIRDLMMPRVSEKNLELIISVAENIPEMVIGDSLRISQTLFNIIGNAVKFTITGSVELRVSAHEELNNKLRLRFAIRDTGIGMDAEQQKNVFKPFTQADNSTARKFGGSGLGLSISKSLIELMGGELSVTSVLGEGSEFAFDIIAERHNDAEFHAADNAYADAANQSYEGFKLLLAEDNEINQEIAKAVLEAKGFTVDIVNNGQEAIEAFNFKSYDLIFMDIRMPIMDGIESTREIRRIERENNGTKSAPIPIIAMTANAMEEDKNATYDVGMNGHLAKPIDLDALSKTLYKILIQKSI